MSIVKINKTIRLSTEVNEKLKRLANANGVFESKIIEMGIEELDTQYKTDLTKQLNQIEQLESSFTK